MTCKYLVNYVNYLHSGREKFAWFPTNTGFVDFFYAFGTINLDDLTYEWMNGPGLTMR